MLFCCLLIFSKSSFSKNSFRNTIKVYNGLDPNQARLFVGLIWVQTVCKGYQQTGYARLSKPDDDDYDDDDDEY